MALNCPSYGGHATRFSVSRRFTVRIGTASGTVYINPTVGHWRNSDDNELYPYPFAYYTSGNLSGTATNAFVSSPFGVSSGMSLMPDPTKLLNSQENGDLWRLIKVLQASQSYARTSVVIDSVQVEARMTNNWNQHGEFRIWTNSHWGIIETDAGIPGYTGNPGNECNFFYVPQGGGVNLILTHPKPQYNVPVGARGKPPPCGDTDADTLYPYMGINSSGVPAEFYTFFPYMAVLRFARLNSTANAGYMTVRITIHCSMSGTLRFPDTMTGDITDVSASQHPMCAEALEWYMRNPFSSFSGSPVSSRELITRLQEWLCDLYKLSNFALRALFTDSMELHKFVQFVSANVVLLTARVQDELSSELDITSRQDP